MLWTILILYVAVSLTIPFWVPILKRLSGDCGVFWVFSVLTYYAYLAWLIFAVLLVLLVYRVPVAGLLWTGVVVLRIVQFSRLSSRSPAGLQSDHISIDVETLTPSGSMDVGDCTGSVAATPAVPATAAPTTVAPAAIAAANAFVGNNTCPTTALGRVLLVGNGPSIRERGFGCTIDSFDTVVRFNSFVTKGLEEHTGSKTSLWCHMMQWYHIYTVEIAQKAAWLPTCYAWNHVVLAPLIFVPNYLMPMLPPAGAITWSLGTYWRAHRAIGLRLHQVRQLCLPSRPLRRRLPIEIEPFYSMLRVQVPTTGFVMLMRLLESVEQLYVIGFDGFGTGRELHYYEERKVQVRVNAAGALLHDWAKEQAAIRRLIDVGRVVPL